jgi:hypothetical protein
MDIIAIDLYESIGLVDRLLDANHTTESLNESYA